MSSFLIMLLQIVSILLDVVSFIVAVQFILSLLIAFNVVSLHNDVVEGVWRGLKTLTDPIYRPIRRILPDVGGIDFSPMVVLILIRIINGPVMIWLYGLIGNLAS